MGSGGKIGEKTLGGSSTMVDVDPISAPRSTFWDAARKKLVLSIFEFFVKSACFASGAKQNAAYSHAFFFRKLKKNDFPSILDRFLRNFDGISKQR